MPRITHTSQGSIAGSGGLEYKLQLTETLMGKPYVYLMFGLSGILLVAWPFGALASIVGLAGHKTGGDSMLLMAVMYTVYVWILAYPIPFIACSILTRKSLSSGNEKRAMILCSLPPGITAVVVGLAFIVGS
jgi:hypothetical protein